MYVCHTWHVMLVPVCHVMYDAMMYCKHKKICRGVPQCGADLTWLKQMGDIAHCSNQCSHVSFSVARVYPQVNHTHGGILYFKTAGIVQPQPQKILKQQRYSASVCDEHDVFPNIPTDDRLDSFQCSFQNVTRRFTVINSNTTRGGGSNNLIHFLSWLPFKRTKGSFP